MSYPALHPRDDLERLYVTRKERGRGPVRTEDCVDAPTKGFEDYIWKGKERQTTAANNRIGNIIANYQRPV